MMSVDRIKLKGQLLTTRSVMRKKGGRLVAVALCELCGADAPLDLHELLLERDDANATPELLKLILESPPNLALLCNPCNVGRAKENTWREFLIGKQISRAGSAWLVKHPSKLTGRPLDLLRIEHGSRILEDWIASLPMKDYKPYLRRVQNVAQAMMKESVHA